MLNYIDEGQIDLIIELMKSFYLYAAIGLLAIILATLIVTNFVAHDKLGKFTTISVAVAVGFSLCVAFSLIALTLARYVLKGRINEYFWAGAGLLCGAVALTAIGLIIKRVAPKAMKAYIYSAIAIAVIYAIVMIIWLPALEGYAPGNKAVYLIISAVIIVLMAVMACLGKTVPQKTTKSITYAAVCISLGFALSYVKFFSMPQGGSVTLASMLPLMLYSYMFGTKKGLYAGLVYGLLQFMQSPRIYEPMQFLLDYPLAFACIGLAGLFRGMKLFKGNKIAEFCVGSTIAASLRFVCHVISGVFVFYSWAGDQNPIVYSLAYNSFVFIDLIIAVAVGVMLLMSKSFSKRLDIAA